MSTPLVFVTVGTDHHPFDRLIGWIDEWSAVHPDVRCFVQTGTSAAPRHCEWTDFLGHEEMAARMAEADIVVAQGGPGTIVISRELGNRPVIVPRRASRGEAVDDHQVTFCRAIAELGDIELAEDEAALGELLDRGLATGGFPCEPGRSPDTAHAVARFAELVRPLLADRAFT